MRILGIDPGSRITGVGVIEVSGQKLRCIEYVCIKTLAKEQAERLLVIYDGIIDILHRHQPQEAAIEKVFVHRNVASALKLGQARGAAMVAVGKCGLQLESYSPNKIKQSITGRGHADKEQVRHMVCRLLNISEVPPMDASDALAIAICHTFHTLTKNKLSMVNQ